MNSTANRLSGLCSIEDEPVLIELNDDLSVDPRSEFATLTSLVRRTYFKYVKKMLLNNVVHTETHISVNDLDEFAKQIELNAVKACMSGMVYRYKMLTEINNIKKLTLIKVPFSNQYTKKIQTPEYDSKDSKPTDGENTSICEVALKTPPSIQNNEDEAVEDNRVLTSENPQESVYDKVYEEMKQLFAFDRTDSPNNRSPEQINASPTSLNSSDRYFSHRDNHFWLMEYEMKKAKLGQCTSSMYELNEQKYHEFTKNTTKLFGLENSPDIETSPLALKKVTYVCKQRMTWHVKKSLNSYYKKKRFRSGDEYRILAKNIVSSLLQINPYLEYQTVYKAIAKAFYKNDVYVDNINQIQKIVSKVSKYVTNMVNNQV